MRHCRKFSLHGLRIGWLPGLLIIANFVAGHASCHQNRAWPYCSLYSHRDCRIPDHVSFSMSRWALVCCSVYSVMINSPDNCICRFYEVCCIVDQKLCAKWLGSYLMKFITCEIKVMWFWQVFFLTLVNSKLEKISTLFIVIAIFITRQVGANKTNNYTITWLSINVTAYFHGPVKAGASNIETIQMVRHQTAAAKP